MNASAWIIVGAMPPITFALGGIWAWLSQIHKRLIEIRNVLIIVSTSNSLPIVKDRQR